MVTVNDVLECARNLIKKHGWKTHQLGTKEVGFCSLGAIEEARSDLQAKPHIYNFAKRRFRKAITGNPQGSIVYWNDYVANTKKRVIDAFDKAIKMGRK